MDDTVTDMPFPLSGVSAAGEFDRQPDGTARHGVNVRAFDPIAFRGRGGSRPGLTKFVPAQPNGANLIQHLNVIVDPTVDALTPDYSGPDAQPVPGPDGGTLLVRPGGSGIAPSRSKRRSSPPTVERFKQKESGYFPSVEALSLSGGVAFDENVDAGNLLVLVVQYVPQGTNTPAIDPGDVTDDLQTEWKLAAVSMYPSASVNAVWIFYGIPPATGPNTVRFTLTVDTITTPNPRIFYGTGYVTATVLEYRVVDSATPVSHTATGGGVMEWNGDVTFSPGACQVGMDNSILVAAVSAILPPAPLTNTYGPAKVFSFDPTPHGRGLGVWDLYNVQSSGSGVSPTWLVHSGQTATGANLIWAGAAVAFNPAI